MVSLFTSLLSFRNLNVYIRGKLVSSGLVVRTPCVPMSREAMSIVGRLPREVRRVLLPSLFRDLLHARVFHRAIIMEIVVRVTRGGYLCSKVFLLRLPNIIVSSLHPSIARLITTLLTTNA